MNEARGCCKYCCKYLSKIDKQNCIKISMDNEKKGSYASNSTYIHNTKINSSDIQQEADKNSQKRNEKHHGGKCELLTEMLHVMLRSQTA